jgi:GntR family transcriptional repressor for pyruvate dehydrogenase complex
MDKPSIDSQAPLTFRPIQATSLSEAIAEQIGNLIASGNLKPGDRLPTESELIKQFGVGRSTVREALKSLAMAGLIETRRRGGTFVTENYTGFLNDRLNWATVFSDREFEDIMEVRIALESQAAALAAERISPADKEKLAHLVDSLETSLNDPERAASYDLKFHVAVAEASENPILMNLIHSIRNLIQEYIRVGYTNQPELSDYSEHRLIYNAIDAGDPERASRVMTWHLTLTRDRRMKK